MSCHAEPDPLRDEGAISPAIVAGLAGVTPEQLERWRAGDLLPASVINDDPDREEFGDPPWYYSWNDHHRVLAAAKLLELGLAETHLSDALARLDDACPQWAATLPQRALEAALPEQVDLRRFWSERRHEGPLGRLFRFADAVEMRPNYCAGEPTVRARRLRTAMLANTYPTLSHTEQMVDEYGLTVYQARRILEFEQALYDAAQVHTPAAG